MEPNFMVQGISQIVDRDTYDLSGIPYPCLVNKLSETDPTKTRDESKNWIRGLRLQKPIWSRLYGLNCVGCCRLTNFSKEKNYCVEIPQHLFSLWGTETVHTMVVEKMCYLRKYQWICNILICCAAVKYNPEEWSPMLLDEILLRACSIYEELCRKHILIHRDFTMRHLCTSMNFKNTTYKINIEQKGHGVMYLPNGHRDCNLARALVEFFRHYQFGLLLCDTRCVAFGFATDVERGYFMYDCQCLGAPLLSQCKANAYVLRTDHLQILLYCLTVALSINSDNVSFRIYNVDVRIEENDLQGRKSISSFADKLFKGVTIKFYTACDDIAKDNFNIDESEKYFELPSSQEKSATDRLLEIDIVKNIETSQSDRIAAGNEKRTAPKVHFHKSLSKALEKLPSTEQKKTESISDKGLMAKNIARKGLNIKGCSKKIQRQHKKVHKSRNGDCSENSASDNSRYIFDTFIKRTCH